MKRLATTLFLIAFVLTAGSAAAGESATARLNGSPLRFIINDKIPPEWAGVWTTTDTIYDCKGNVMQAGTSTDTLCANTQFEPNPDYVCTTSATSTTFHQSCTGSGTVLTCTYDVTLESNGTRTGDSYSTVTTIVTHYSGPADPCALFPDDCTQVNTHGTRTGPADPVYCATPTLPATWGELKNRYR
jgi:hypothetical protein